MGEELKPISLATALIVGAVMAAATMAQDALAQDRAAIAAGEAVYQEHCMACHGERVISPGGAYDLRKLGADERPRFDKVMADGKGQMPSWEGILTTEEFDQVWAYIRSRTIN